MDETNNLAFDIRARILPQIEGINEFAQNLRIQPILLSNKLTMLSEVPDSKKV